MQKSNDTEQRELRCTMHLSWALSASASIEQGPLQVQSPKQCSHRSNEVSTSRRRNVDSRSGQNLTKSSSIQSSLSKLIYFHTWRINNCEFLSFGICLPSVPLHHFTRKVWCEKNIIHCAVLIIVSINVGGRTRSSSYKNAGRHQSSPYGDAWSSNRD
jgi:hypothetical protein